MDRINIGFCMMGGEGWTAGLVYLKNLFYALRQTYGDKVGLYLLVLRSHQNIDSYTHYMEADNIIFMRTPLWVVNKLSNCLLLRDIVMERLLSKQQIDAVFGLALTYKYLQIATLSFLPDFQHVHFPEMFSKSECLYRNKRFLKCASIATRVILASESTKKDFISFAPVYAHKAKVLHPLSYITQSVYEYDLHHILHLYNLPKKFVYLPNQFWRHKNHELVFYTLKILKDRGIKVILVCSGYPGDYRHPSYFADLWQKLDQWDIRDQVIYLNLIPHEHVLLLMRQSICVINPSLFEGWGITVDEARSVGKQILLSDIPAHREQNPPQAIFFNQRDCEDLASKLKQIWQEKEPGPDIELEIEARRSLPDRIRTYAESFMSVVQEVVNR